MISQGYNKIPPKGLLKRSGIPSGVYDICEYINLNEILIEYKLINIH